MNARFRRCGAGLGFLLLGGIACGGSDQPEQDAGDGGLGDAATDGLLADKGEAGASVDGWSNDGADRGDGSGSEGGTGALGAPTDIAASVLDRRKVTVRLTWVAPSDSGGHRVGGYEVRYAQVPITSANFDDPAVTTRVPFTGVPMMPGQIDGLTVTGLVIENVYYFAAAATDGGATRSAPAATTGSVSSHFNLTQIPSPSGTDQRFGFSVSGEGDLNGDGLSDILVGTAQGSKAYLFFGNPNLAAAAPSVTFSAASAGFGFSVAQIGDIDKDGLADIAISDPVGGQKVYIYKGRSTWPMTLTDTQADYVISTDSSYTSSLFGFSLAKLGDFTGDGVDDMAIGARNYNGGVGRIVIIAGKAGFASVALPDSANSIVIDGDAALGASFFGYRVLGLGHFFSVSAGTTLIASAPSGAAGTAASAGHVYAFHGQAGTAGSIPISSADAVVVGPMIGSKIGIVLADLGPMFNNVPGVGIGNTQDTVDVSGASGTGLVTFGTASSGPFANTRLLYLTGGTSVGAVMIGGGLRGSDSALSLIGDGTPDLVFGGQLGPVLTISDGAKISAKTAPLDLSSSAEVRISLPTGWGSGEAAATMLSDANGDGYADFCIGSLNNPGAVLVLW